MLTIEGIKKILTNDKFNTKHDLDDAENFATIASLDHQYDKGMDSCKEFPVFYILFNDDISVSVKSQWFDPSGLPIVRPLMVNAGDWLKYQFDDGVKMGVIYKVDRDDRIIYWFDKNNTYNIDMKDAEDSERVSFINENVLT